jgi:predicted nucleic acid-binding protein
MTTGEPLIFDTTVWVDALNGTTTPGSNLLISYIQHNLPVVLTPTIVQEVLQGIRDDKDYTRTKNNLTGFLILPVDMVDAAIGAAELYRKLRKKGVTIRKANDCLIAFYAISHNMTVVHNDSDFDLIAGYSALKVRRA